MIKTYRSRTDVDPSSIQGKGSEDKTRLQDRTAVLSNATLVQKTLANTNVLSTLPVLFNTAIYRIKRIARSLVIRNKHPACVLSLVPHEVSSSRRIGVGLQHHRFCKETCVFLVHSEKYRFFNNGSLQHHRFFSHFHCM